MLDILFINTQQPAVPVNPEANDITFEDGDIATVSGPARIFQDLANNILTSKGSDSITPSRGSVIPGLTGAAVNPNTLNSEISDGINQAVSFLVAVEPVSTPDETIQGIQSLEVTLPTGDPSEADIDLVILLQNGSTVGVQT